MKQSITELKAVQGYSHSPRNCGACVNLSFKGELPAWMREHNECLSDGKREFSNGGKPYGNEHKVRKQLRCSIGGFAVKSSATCDRYKARP